MDKITKSLLQQVESGEYFEDAREWYARKYLSPFSERIFLVICTILLLMTFIVAVWDFDGLYPKKIFEQFLIESDNTLDYYAKIKSLDHVDKKSNKSIYKSIAKYIVTQYVIERESYKKNNYTEEVLEQQKLYIRNNSTNQVYRGFEELISTKNPESPILQFRNNTTREIIISKVIFPDNNDANFVKVYYDALDRNGKQIIKNKYVASINYILTDVEQVLSENLPLEFKVSNYKVDKWIKDND